MPLWVAQLIGAIFAIAGAILVTVFLLPEKKREKVSPALRKIADFCNFKFFWLEYILKFLYVVCTLYCVVAGFFMLFSWETSVSSLFGMGATVSHAPAGIILMLAGPIVVRLVFEASMLFLKLVGNVTQINQKLSSKDGKGSDE